jgi:glycerol-3-phosphate O-acyltransferase
MNVTRHLLRPWYWFTGKVFGFWARPAVQPDEPATLFAGSDAPVCYVLESGGLADTLALERLCRIHGLPAPTDSLSCCGIIESRRIVVLKRMRGLIFRRRHATGSKRLKRLIEASIEAGGKELLLVPVGIYWGRSPKKDHSWLSLLFSEHWDVAGRTRKFFTTVFQGRNTLLRFSHPLPLSSIVQDGHELEVSFRKVSRILRVHFRQRRIATVGPDLSHRRTLLNDVLNDPNVRSVIDAESADNRVKLEVRRKKHVLMPGKLPRTFPTRQFELLSDSSAGSGTEFTTAWKFSTSRYCMKKPRITR